MSETTTDDATSADTTTTDDATTEPVEGETADTTEGETALGDAGKKALDAMKAERNDARKQAREVREELERLRSEAALKDKPAEEQALEAARAEARVEAAGKANERILRSELRASATGKLADPSDAALYIDLTDFEVGDDGEVDSEALNDAITDLLTRKPHLAAGKPNRFDGDADQGARGKETKVSQLRREDLATMTPQQIVQAQNAGKLTELGFQPNK